MSNIKKEIKNFQILPHRLKNVVIREELFALTQDTFEAIILGQMLYWSERMNDVDDFILEEQKRRKEGNMDNLNIGLQNGWIYKSAQQLKEECMLNLSISSIRRYLQKLIDKGYLSERKNPDNKWDRVLQYRLNLHFIINEVKKLGYDGLSHYKSSEVQNEFTNRQNEKSNKQIDDAIPEITTEITIENTTENTTENNKKEIKKKKKEISSIEEDTSCMSMPDIFIEYNKDEATQQADYKDVSTKCVDYGGDDDFIDKIYKIYPTRCPKRDMPLGKSYKDKDRIRKLLKQYSKEDIEKVVRFEVNSKYGKSYMSNFSTFLNNFPDPECIDADYVDIKEEDKKKEKLIINGVEYQ